MKRSEWLELRAGVVRLYYTDGELRYLRVNDHEVLRRLYVAVRDQWWNTVPLQISNLQTQVAEEHFHLTFTATHQEGEIDFIWQGTITGEANGTIEFTMDGEAHSTFLRNRIGICVLHPPRECAGQPCWIEHPDGSVEAGEFPTFIAPHQPCKDIRALTHEVAPGLKAEVRFTGDTFETEDQRNWTDNSFKTYNTPLHLPFPVEITPGTKIAQSVTVSLRGKVPPPLPAAAQGPVKLTLGTLAIGSLPRIGLGVASHGHALSPREIDLLRKLNLSHLRVDLLLSQPEYEATLLRATNEAYALGVKLEIALFLTAAAETELRTFAAILQRIKPPVVRWLIFDVDEQVTPENPVNFARAILQQYDPAAQFGAGTNHYFTELNRHRPAAGLAEVICYSINPQVHATDDVSLAETLETQAATLKSARQFVGDAQIAVTPITLKPRFNPHTATPADLSEPDALPASVDARQMSLFGAAWTAGSLKYLAEGGAASVTYYETTGWRGVLETSAGSPLPELFPSWPGATFPLYHVFADVGEFSAAEIVPVTSSEPLRVVGLALRQETKLRLLLANISGLTQHVELHFLPGTLRMKRLNDATLAAAMRQPEAFRDAVGASLTTQDGWLVIELQPDEIVRLDFG